ncbi:hypothetical protein [Krasilnikovia sp. M28-CT-15]|uniref:hypothetical protein n=1 Tax=Krasilnikovia sp. M28-CT-15 TaxID=3373540 RepID=UPI003875F6C5
MWDDIDSEITDWSSTRIRQWISDLDEQAAPRSVNWWIGIRQRLQHRVYDRDLPADLRREWGEVVLLLMDCAVRIAGGDPWSTAVGKFHLRGLLIRELGPVPGDTTWDQIALTREVLATTTLDVDHAREMAGHWRTLPTEEIRVLRQHKSLFAPLALLADQLPEGDYSEQVNAWLVVQPTLP